MLTTWNFNWKAYALDPKAIVPLASVVVLNSTIDTRADTHVLYASYI